jgi:hypothetical protein
VLCPFFLPAVLFPELKLGSWFVAVRKLWWFAGGSEVLRWSAGSPELCSVCALGCCLINPSWVVKPPSAPPRWSSFLAGGGSPLHCLVVINLFAFCFRWALSTEISQMSDVFISDLEIFAVLLNSGWSNPLLVWLVVCFFDGLGPLVPFQIC